MAYIARDLEHNMSDALQETHVGINSECVSLVKAWTSAPQTAHWVKGALVKGNHALTRGTVIATFENGHYHGHAAIFLGEVNDGIRVFDQWNGQRPHERIIHYTGKHAFVDDGNNYYVVD